MDVYTQLNSISFTKHFFRCTVTICSIVILFKILHIALSLEDVKCMLFFMVGFDILFSFISKANAYYLRSALSYCMINLTFCLLQILSH